LHFVSPAVNMSPFVSLPREVSFHMSPSAFIFSCSEHVSIRDPPSWSVAPYVSFRISFLLQSMCLHLWPCFLKCCSMSPLAFSVSPCVAVCVCLSSEICVWCPRLCLCGILVSYHVYIDACCSVTVLHSLLQ
jgi:hypothetical protein